MCRFFGLVSQPGDVLLVCAGPHKVVRFECVRILCGNRGAGFWPLADEAAPAGVRLHAVAGEAVPVREIAEAVRRHPNLPVRPGRRADGWEPDGTGPIAGIDPVTILLASDQIPR